MKRNIARTTLVIAALTAFTSTVVPSAYAQSCTDAVLNGSYAFTFSGWGTPPPNMATEGKSSIPTGAVGVINFDGAGNWSTSFTYSHDGTITSATSVPGTYTVASNCTGTMAGVGDFAVVVLHDGAEITGVETDKDSTTTIEARRQNATACSNATLSGNYAVTLAGFGTPPPKLSPGNASVPVALSGLAVFDGAGTFTGSFTNSDNGHISTRPADTGAYRVGSDCTGTLTDLTAGVHFAIVLLDGGAEAFGLQTDIGTAVALDAKKQ